MTSLALWKLTTFKIWTWMIQWMITQLKSGTTTYQKWNWPKLNFVIVYESTFFRNSNFALQICPKCETLKTLTFQLRAFKPDTSSSNQYALQSLFHFHFQYNFLSPSSAARKFSRNFGQNALKFRKFRPLLSQISGVFGLFLTQNFQFLPLPLVFIAFLCANFLKM